VCAHKLDMPVLYAADGLRFETGWRVRMNSTQGVSRLR